MISVSKYLKDTEDTAPHVYVSVSWIHFKSIFPNPGTQPLPCLIPLQDHEKVFRRDLHTRAEVHRRAQQELHRADLLVTFHHRLMQRCRLPHLLGNMSTRTNWADPSFRGQYLQPF